MDGSGFGRGIVAPAVVLLICFGILLLGIGIVMGKFLF